MSSNFIISYVALDSFFNFLTPNTRNMKLKFGTLFLFHAKPDLTALKPVKSI